MVLDEAFKLSARDEVLQPDIRKTGIHPNFWYPVARSDNVKTGKPHGVSFAGEPIVLVRTECCSCPDFVDNKNGLFARCIFGNLFIEPGTPERLATEERLASRSQFKGTLQTLQVSELSRSIKTGETDSVCDTRIRANVARSTFFQQCKSGKRTWLSPDLLDRPRHSRCGGRFRRVPPRASCCRPIFFDAREATILSNHGSPRSGSQNRSSFDSP